MHSLAPRVDEARTLSMNTCILEDTIAAFSPCSYSTQQLKILFRHLPTRTLFRHECHYRRC
jgi:hypothetical protein